MTNLEFHNLCNRTPAGTPLTFHTGTHRVRGKFVGCSEDGILIEANEKVFIWPKDLIDFGKNDYPIPSYS